MKKLFAVAVIGVAMTGVAAFSISDAVAAPSEARVDLDQVNAKIDARLHDVLGQLIAQRAGR